MIATAIKPPRSRAEILADQNLSVWAKGQEISALLQWEVEHPLPPEPPLPLSIGERASLENTKAALERLMANFETVEMRQKKYADELPALVEKFRALQTANLPDAADDVLLAEMLTENRIQKMQKFLANVSLERELMERQLSGHFARLNDLLIRFKVQQFFLSGSRPALTARGCVSFLEQFLKQ